MYLGHMVAIPFSTISFKCKFLVAILVSIALCAEYFLVEDLDILHIFECPELELGPWDYITESYVVIRAQLWTISAHLITVDDVYFDI